MRGDEIVFEIFFRQQKKTQQHTYNCACFRHPTKNGTIKNALIHILLDFHEYILPKDIPYVCTTKSLVI